MKSPSNYPVDGEGKEERFGLAWRAYGLTLSSASLLADLLNLSL
jgi:hypothetical protein